MHLCMLGLCLPAHEVLIPLRVFITTYDTAVQSVARMPIQVANLSKDDFALDVAEIERG